MVETACSIRPPRTGARGIDPARGNGVDGDAVGGELLSEAARQTDHGGLVGTVEQLARGDGEGVDGGEVDDAASAGGPQGRNGFGGDVEGAEDVHVEDAPVRRLVAVGEKGGGWLRQMADTERLLAAYEASSGSAVSLRVSSADEDFCCRTAGRASSDSPTGRC